KKPGRQGSVLARRKIGLADQTVNCTPSLASGHPMRRATYTSRRVRGCRRSSQLLAADSPNTAAAITGTLHAAPGPALAPARSARSRNSGWIRYTPNVSGARVDSGGTRGVFMIHWNAASDMNGTVTLK